MGNFRGLDRHIRGKCQAQHESRAKNKLMGRFIYGRGVVKRSPKKNPATGIQADREKGASGSRQKHKPTGVFALCFTIRSTIGRHLKRGRGYPYTVVATSGINGGV